MNSVVFMLVLSSSTLKVVGNFRYITLGQRMLAKHKVGDPT
nr:hypothetical protein Iba_chr14eCG0160 [Ipomoea batatas]